MTWFLHYASKMCVYLVTKTRGLTRKSRLISWLAYNTRYQGGQEEVSTMGKKTLAYSRDTKSVDPRAEARWSPVRGWVECKPLPLAKTH